MFCMYKRASCFFIFTIAVVERQNVVKFTKKSPCFNSVFLFLLYHRIIFIHFCINGIPLKLMLGVQTMLHFPLLTINRLNKTESVVSMSWVHSVLPKDPFYVFINLFIMKSYCLPMNQFLKNIGTYGLNVHAFQNNKL